MNILNLLSKEKLVAGIEISDSVVRIALLRKRGKEKNLQQTSQNTPLENELILIEESIAPNIIENGIVTDPDLLSKTLAGIWSRAGLGTNYAIVAIPDDTIYSRIFSFPRSVEGARLTEAMRLAIGFQLPMKTSELYLDWERTGGTKTANEILLSTIPRTIAQGYVQALDNAGIKTLALESHLASIARAVKTEADTTMLITAKTPDGITVFILKNGILRFSRTLPTHFVPEDKRAEEIHKIKTAYEAEHKVPVTVHENTELNISDAYASYPMPEPHAKWLIAIGAVMRAQIPEGEDNLISLLPIGTEEAYAYQKATTFIVLMRNLIVGVSVFFALAFLGVYLFMLNANRTVATLSIPTVPKEILDKEAWVGRLNTVTETTQTLISQTPLWSIVVTEINARIIPGIKISSLNATLLTEGMSLTGTAKDRSTLNQFEKNLKESPLLTDVTIPLANLEQRENIPFSATFRIKDPGVLYYN